MNDTAVSGAAWGLADNGRIRYHCDRCADGSGHGATTLAADFSDKVSFVFIIQIEH